MFDYVVWCCVDLVVVDLDLCEVVGDVVVVGKLECCVGCCGGFVYVVGVGYVGVILLGGVVG